MPLITYYLSLHLHNVSQEYFHNPMIKDKCGFYNNHKPTLNEHSIFDGSTQMSGYSVLYLEHPILGVIFQPLEMTKVDATCLYPNL